MIMKTLKVSALLFLLALAVFWLVTGGIQKVTSSGQSYFNPLAWYMGGSNATGTLFQLPWKEDVMVSGPEIYDFDTSSQDTFVPGSGYVIPEDASASLLQDPRTFGNPSPYRGYVALAQGVTGENDPASEYLSIVANPQADTPTTITGWSLHSTVTGVRAYIPEGTPFFVLGSVNKTRSIELAPGNVAVLMSGSSPIGVSFQENMCTGYLNELQQFSPPLPLECPDSSSALSLNAENIRTYGEECLYFVSTVGQCHFPTTMPETLSPACRSVVANNLSYNGCVQANQRSAYFTRPTWRVYLGSPVGLWQNVHDVVRLLDERGQVVDVLTY